MTRLIDVDALIEKIEKDEFDHVRNDYQSGYNDGILHAEVVADNFPTVDAVPVKHGKWIQVGHIEHMQIVYKCSACNGQTIVDGYFCTNCGARMDGK